jgi:type VI secretion system protein ImpK
MPLQVRPLLATRLGAGASFSHGAHSPLVHALAAGVLLLAVWWGLNHWLSAEVARLLAGQA